MAPSCTYGGVLKGFPDRNRSGRQGMSAVGPAANATMHLGHDIFRCRGTLGEDRCAPPRRDRSGGLMKVGKNLKKSQPPSPAAGLMGRAIYVERRTRCGGEQIMPLSEAPTAAEPYFSMVMIPGQGTTI